METKETEAPALTAGVPCWADLSTTDMDAAIEFYRGLFDWSGEKGPAEFGGYAVMRMGEKSVAGIAPVMEGQPTAWLTHVLVDDAAASVTRARELGATIMVEPMAIASEGTFSVIADPTGAALGLWQAGNHRGAQLFNQPGGICWNELGTRDTAAAEKFYGALFGWTPKTSDANDPAQVALGERHESTPGDGMKYTEFQLGERSVAGMIDISTMLPAEVPANWLTYFTVEDCAATVAKATELGGTVMSEPRHIGFGTMAVLNDPQGAVFAVIDLKS